MKTDKERAKIIGVVGTAVIHVLALILLLFVIIDKPEPQSEGGVEVMLGMADAGSGDGDDLVPVEIETPEPETDVEEQPMLVQEEPSVSLPEENKEEKKKDIEQEKKKTQEEIEREKQIEREKRANSVVSGAFGRGESMGEGGEGDKAGRKGSEDGNSSRGLTEGLGGFGSFDLRGRGLGPGGLPVPEYNVKEEGTVVVDIWVNPAGTVVRTGINIARTNTSSTALRKAAEKAAAKARFNAIGGVENQRGTITYNFKLK